MSKMYKVSEPPRPLPHSVRNQPDKAYSTGITTAKSQQPSQQSEVFIKIEFN